MPVVEKRLLSWGDVETPGGSGGPTIPFKATVALKVGDAVVLAAAGFVTKTAVAADGARFAGVVVGGGNNFGGDYALEDSGSTGYAIAAANKSVQVRVAGIVWVVAGAAVLVNAKLGLDTTTAGRVLTTITAGLIVGIAIDAAAASGDKIRMLIQPR